MSVNNMTKGWKNEGMRHSLARKGINTKEPYPAHAFPGGYPIFYMTADGGVLCPSCANENKELTNDPDDKQWYVVDADANYEDAHLYCDHCSKRIESAYADDDQKLDSNDPVIRQMYKL